MIQGKPPVWETENWEQKLGVPNVAMHTQEMARGKGIDSWTSISQPAAVQHEAQPAEHLALAESIAAVDRLPHPLCHRFVVSHGFLPMASPIVVSNVAIDSKMDNLDIGG